MFKPLFAFCLSLAIAWQVLPHLGLPYIAAPQEFSDIEKAQLKKIVREFGRARKSLILIEQRIATAERRLVTLLYTHDQIDDEADALPPLPAPVEPDTDDGEPDAIPGMFAGLPFTVPPIPSYSVPTIVDCHWTIKDGIATSTRQLDEIIGVPNSSTGGIDVVGAAYQASLDAGHALPITIGIWDDGGRAVIGGLYNARGSDAVCPPDGEGGFLDVSIELVGLDDSCELILDWSTKWGKADYIGVFNIGLRGVQSSFIIGANDGINRLVMDGCWWLPHLPADGSYFTHASGLHIDNWNSFVWRRHKYRGVNPEDPGIRLREHLVYFKSCVGTGPEAGTWIIENDLRGGNRTGFQVRPSPDGSYPSARPTGPLVIAYNESYGYGWEFANEDGGAALTAWIGPETDVYVVRNIVSDARYGALVVSGQAPDRNYLNDDGFPIKSLFIYGNQFENNRAKRVAVSVSAVGQIDWYTNSIDGPQNGDISLDAAWNMRINGIYNGPMRIHSQATLDDLLSLKIGTFDPSNPNREKPMDPAVLSSYLVEE